MTKLLYFVTITFKLKKCIERQTIRREIAHEGASNDPFKIGHKSESKINVKLILLLFGTIFLQDSRESQISFSSDKSRTSKYEVRCK